MNKAIAKIREIYKKNYYHTRLGERCQDISEEQMFKAIMMEVTELIFSKVEDDRSSEQYNIQEFADIQCILWDFAINRRKWKLKDVEKEMVHKLNIRWEERDKYGYPKLKPRRKANGQRRSTIKSRI